MNAGGGERTAPQTSRRLLHRIDSLSLVGCDGDGHETARRIAASEPPHS